MDYSFSLLTNRCEFLHFLLSFHKGIFNTWMEMGNGMTELDWWTCVQWNKRHAIISLLRPNEQIPLLTSGDILCVSTGLLCPVPVTGKNHFGITAAVVRGAFQVIYTLCLYRKSSVPYCKTLRKSLSNLNSILQTWEADETSKMWALPLNTLEDHL